MKESTTNVTLYISDDGAKQSTDKTIVERYEFWQNKQQFENRVFIKHICDGTSLCELPNP